MTESDPPRRFPDAREDLERWERVPDTPQTRSPSYRLAFSDPDFLTRDELRPVRLQLELLKTEMALAERGIVSTVVMFGSARIPDPATAAASQPRAAGLARLLRARRATSPGSARSARSPAATARTWSAPAAGPAIMEAGNRGAAEAGGVSISLNIVLPHEQAPNRYGTPELSFNFHYFAIRKMHFLMRAQALAVFPGGFGTLDELFEALTLVQTGRMEPLPILLFGGDFWRRRGRLAGAGRRRHHRRRRPRPPHPRRPAPPRPGSGSTPGARNEGRPQPVRPERCSRRCGEGIQATACSPFLATSVRSLSEAPRGRFSPRSHWLTRPVVTLRWRAKTAWLGVLSNPDSPDLLRRQRLHRRQAHRVEVPHRPP